MDNIVDETFKSAIDLVKKAKGLTKDDTNITTEELLFGFIAIKQVKHHIAEEGAIVDKAIKIAEKNFEVDTRKYLGRGWDHATQNIIHDLKG